MHWRRPCACTRPGRRGDADRLCRRKFCGPSLGDGGKGGLAESNEAAELTLQGVAASIRKAGFWGFWKVDRSVASVLTTNYNIQRAAEIVSIEAGLAIIHRPAGQEHTRQ